MKLESYPIREAWVTRRALYIEAESFGAVNPLAAINRARAELAAADRKDATPPRLAPVREAADRLCFRVSARALALMIEGGMDHEQAWAQAREEHGITLEPSAEEAALA